MKRNALVLLLLACCCALCFSQQSVFVSASGSDENHGRSEEAPFRTLAKAFAEVRSSGVNRITIIGALDAADEKGSENDSVFTAALPIRTTELLITGLRGASGARRAVLSGRNSGLPVLGVNGAETRVRLENIEIIGGEGEEGIGLLVLKGGTITLGPGAVVRDNHTGIKLTEGTCIIDGGEVRDNSASGILVSDLCVLTMRGGFIRNNGGRGVFVQRGGRFSMTAGSVTGNRDADSGAGVYIQAGGRFDQTAGTVDGNFAPEFPNICREQGAFGNDLSMDETKSPSSDPSVNNKRDAFAGVKFHVPFFIGLYGQGWRENIFSIGLLLQIGFQADFGNAFSIALLGEADGGLGYPYILDGNLLGVVEMYFTEKKIGFGGGYGIHGRTMHVDDVMASSSIEIGSGQEVFFYRFGLIIPFPVKTVLFANYYDRGNWGNIENWGFGIQLSRIIF